VPELDKEGVQRNYSATTVGRPGGLGAPGTRLVVAQQPMETMHALPSPMVTGRSYMLSKTWVHSPYSRDGKKKFFFKGRGEGCHLW
jgi:hypothetical protein